MTLAVELAPAPDPLAACARLTFGATGAGVTEPLSGRASPRFANALVVSYGKRPATVVGASGSFLDLKSFQACRPALAPKRF